MIPPIEAHDSACADSGRGSEASNGSLERVDTVTDLLKNRVDTAVYQTVTVAEILSLPWQGLPVRRFEWQPKDSVMVSAYEAAPVAVEGFIVAIREEGKEATNCEIDTPAWHDWHMWLVATEDEAHRMDKTKAVVLEITPRVRARAGNAGAFDKAQIQKWARDGQQVRASGWLLLDPDHPGHVGQSRGTTWEVHPVMKLEPVK